jgi:hypothetical protein
MHTCSALCTRTADICDDKLTEIVGAVFNITADIAKSLIEGQPIDMQDIIKNAGEAALALANTVCDLPKAFFERFLHK